MIKKNKIAVFVLVCLFLFITIYYFFMRGITVEIYQQKPFHKHWIWLNDKVSSHKISFKSNKLRIKVIVNDDYPNALIFWQLKKRYAEFSQAGFEVRKDDVGLCKKIVHIDEIGKIKQQTSFYKNKYGLCGKEGKVKNY